MTNFSLGVTTASLTHMIKMSEPLITAVLMTLMGKISFNYNLVIIIAAILTTAVASEPWSESQTSLLGILLALGSNVCFALRNIGTKYFSVKDETQGKTTIQGFAAISLSGFIALIPLLLIQFYLFGYSASASLLSNHYLLLSASNHVVYNIISLTAVLVVFDPLQHALLNVAKRVSIVLVFYLFIQQNFALLNSMFAVTCLIISIEGTKIVKEDVKDFWKILLQKLSIGFIAVMVYCLFTDAVETMLKARFYSKITTNNESLSEKTSWIHCIEDIQGSHLKFFLF